MNVFNPPGKSLRAFFLPTKIQQCSKFKFSMSLWKIIETKWTTWETPPEAPVIVGQNIRNSENKTHNPFINPPSTIFSQNIRKLQKIKAFPVLIPGCNFLFPGKGDGKLIVGFPNFRMGTGMNIFFLCFAPTAFAIVFCVFHHPLAWTGNTDISLCYATNGSLCVSLCFNDTGCRNTFSALICFATAMVACTGCSEGATCPKAFDELHIRQGGRKPLNTSLCKA